MSSGKKGKKSKGKTLALTDFLAETPGGIPSVPLKASNWADDVEDDYGGGYSSRSSKEPVVLPTAPRAARGPGINEENIPTNPPYVAYISNLPYDVDEEDLAEFFADMQVSNMRLPKDSNKLRGYGYVEFDDRQSLIDALSMPNTTIKTRRVRIEVSNSSNDERRGGRMGRDNRRDNYDDPDRTSGDWRSGPREEISSSDGDRFRSRGGFENRDRRDDREKPDYDNKPGGWREGGDRGGSAFRDRGGFRDEDRERDWPRYGDRDGDRDKDRGSSFGPRRNFGDSDWDRDGPRRQARPSTMDSTQGEPRTRPKLQLQPRTKPVEPILVKDEPTEAEAEAESAPSSTSTSAQAPAPTPVPAVNIFGAAKPVDTTAREREIEERLAKTYAESKSKDEGDADKRSTKEGTWGRRNGEGREDRDRGRPTWRSDEDRGRQAERSGPRPATSARSGQRGDSRGPPTSRGGPARAGQKSSDSRAPPERERREKDRDDDVNRMPKAKDEQAPNFIASNKYSMLPDDVDPDNIDD
ncbi:eukaryotic translation initiation factor 4B [Cephus cinctus]|uniref:Eukaryotic translation initiation factor 4B n=1 Tax=Cephus cinctus TaxID=211228 RepID=A0AAJ7BPB2_CEPCN|nr:eukaryotic translation initiation factor 4B [Cephus cinctus]